MSTPTPTTRIVSTGRYLPERVLTNDDLTEMVDTSDEWIRERTGIRERRIAAEGEMAADMAAAASRIALERAGKSPEEVDKLIVSTATPDRFLPSTACDLQSLIGADRAVAYDITAACTGFLYGLSIGEGYVAAGRGETVLVASTERMSSIVDWTDRTTCVLFGDGAGAAVLGPAEGDRGILSIVQRSDGKLGELLWRPAGGNRIPFGPEVLETGDHFLRMKGREIFKSAVRNMADSCVEAMEKAGVDADDIDLMIPHQANIRIIEATAKYAGFPMERVFVNLDRYGNMSSASVPVALDETIEQGLVGEGSLILTVAFGAGLTWGAMVIRL